MKLTIFLDIDGVFKNPKNHEDWYQNSIELFNLALEKIDSEIVISSNWKLIKNIDFFNKIFNGKVVGFTEDLSFNDPYVIKEKECLQYINKNKIKNYVFIDDNDYEFSKNKNKLIKIDPNKGFDMESFNKLLSYRNPKRKNNSIRI